MIMRIFSELTNKYYSTVEECLAAEEKYNEEKNRELEEKRAREEERKTMEAYVNDCHKKLVEAQNLYIKAKQDYLKKYGGYDSLFKILF